MTLATSPQPACVPRSRARRAKRSPASIARRSERAILGRYTDPAGRPREVVARSACAGSVLVIDRDAHTLRDRRLVAHLGADEPSGNAALVCRHYLQDQHGRRCRPLAPADLRSPDPASSGPSDDGSPAAPLTDRHDRAYRLGPVISRLSIPDIRWLRHSPGDLAAPPQTVSLRDVVAALESYEPARLRTVSALASHYEKPAVSVAVLRAELARLDASRIVLNRGLREAVLSAVRLEGLSMSEIAVRCGRVKRDSRGNTSGETSWLTRRIGILPEGGEQAPTPWIHSDVLALIARAGLGISPREVELG